MAWRTGQMEIRTNTTNTHTLLNERKGRERLAAAKEHRLTLLYELSARPQHDTILRHTLPEVSNASHGAQR
ncbi:unnamed protein product [Rhizoctonia solani]|nr:unnamed protein product [Rhizoctonia solani]